MRHLCGEPPNFCNAIGRKSRIEAKYPCLKHVIGYSVKHRKQHGP